MFKITRLLQTICFSTNKVIIVFVFFKKLCLWVDTDKIFVKLLSNVNTRTLVD